VTKKEYVKTVNCSVYNCTQLELGYRHWIGPALKRGRRM
jgi:hypothetical protein